MSQSSRSLRSAGRRTFKEVVGRTRGHAKPAFLCALEAFGAHHIVTGSDYPRLQDWEVCRSAYIDRLGLPKEVTEKVLRQYAHSPFKR